MGPLDDRGVSVLERVLRPVPLLREKLFEPGFPVRKIGLGDRTGQGDPILVRDLVKDIDRGAIAQKYALGVNSD